MRSSHRAIVVSFLALLLAPQSLVAANRFIRANAAPGGIGSDWANAFTCIPATLVRGNTYYIAAGDYRPCGANRSFADNESGSLVITLKKATVADHGTDIGWSDTFAQGQAVFLAHWRIETGFYTVDGQERAGLESGYGIKIDNTTARDPFRALIIGIPGDPTPAKNITVRFVEVEGTHSTDDTFNDFAIDITGGSDNLTISHCYVHDTGDSIINTGAQLPTTNVLLEHTVIARDDSSSSFHAEGISISSFNNVTLRFNLFKDLEGTAAIATPNSKGASLNNVYIYGNVFMRSVNPPSFLGRLGDGILSILAGTTITGDFFIYNNTISRISDANNSGSSRMRIDPAANIAAATFRVWNNLWYDCSPQDQGGPVYSNNAYYDTTSISDTDPNKEVKTGSPFVDFAAENLRLSIPTRGGQTLPAPFDKDLRGISRGTDANWDRGSFEFRRPDPPTFLR